MHSATQRMFHKTPASLFCLLKLQLELRNREILLLCEEPESKKEEGFGPLLGVNV